VKLYGKYARTSLVSLKRDKNEKETREDKELRGRKRISAVLADHEHSR
jgi:hypothetical protein